MNDGAPFGSPLLGPADEAPRALRVRVQTLTTAAILTAHVVGVAAVIALVAWVLPRPEPMSDGLVLANAIGIPAYVGFALVVGVVWGTRGAIGRLAWILEDRPPDDDERRDALAVPMHLVRVQAVLWAGGVAVFTILTVAVQAELTVVVGLAVALGGVVTCMAAYLQSEFVMRPVAARALGSEHPGDVPVPGMTVRSLLAWALGSAVPVVGAMVVAVIALARGDVSADRLAVVALVLGGIAVSVGGLLTWLAVRAVVDPVRALRAAVERVEAGDLDTVVTVFDGTEIGLLQRAFNRMIEGLRERERIRDLFGRHVGEDVARDALAREVELGGELREVAVLFVDVIGSTELAHTRPPEAVVAALNRFFAVVVDVVDGAGGTINKFEGDGALAVFGAPVPIDDHHGAALEAARVLHRRLHDEVSELEAGIGVASGQVVAGNVGEERRFEYTVIGDPVNEAARLCEMAKSVDGRVVASMSTVEAADGAEAGRWRAGEEVHLRGRSAPTRTACPQADEPPG